MTKMKNNLTKKGTVRKNKPGAGRPKLFEEETKELRRLIPISQYSKLEAILDYEISKLKKK